jgi:hypothetical protein
VLGLLTAATVAGKLIFAWVFGAADEKYGWVRWSVGDSLPRKLDVS